jgi:hypothetical protein
MDSYKNQSLLFWTRFRVNATKNYFIYISFECVERVEFNRLMQLLLHRSHIVKNLLNKYDNHVNCHKNVINKTQNAPVEKHMQVNLNQ